jgi:hypothetical protein
MRSTIIRTETPSGFALQRERLASFTGDARISLILGQFERDVPVMCGALRVFCPRFYHPSSRNFDRTLKATRIQSF